MDIQEYGEYQVRIITDLGDHQKNLMHMAGGTFNADHAIHRDTVAEKAAMEGQ